LSHVVLARIALSLLCALQGLATLAIDFNRTHATNPTWTGHARFHVVWQGFSVVLMSVLELALIWFPGHYQKDAFYLAVLLTAVSPAAFVVALAGRKIFGGTLWDPNGIPPVRPTILGVRRSIDLNVAAVVAALVCLGIIIAIY
jgi:hypothetical protein